MEMLIASSSSASGAYGMGSMLIWIVVMIAMFYFLLIRPQKKEQKKVQAMLSEMAVGDAVVTTGGFYGIIIDITEEDVIVEFGNNKNCRIPMRKSAIAEVEKPELATSETKDKEEKKKDEKKK
ncbi:MAG TPA: preprotein translocase subunit YajC [Candidatus Fusicatenibacter intestinigallinarum]|uniref:Preprotein translocase subunit YajC n=1 Tax=Candidatus Fusicatenibacter intestinigallinarum TaxID=2838598 RepID=A0A9D2NCQ5_9FIRM|nr:preprotein translocase subunit YajC [Candidatus Fusicatenibacter intestinigallinarum]